MAGAWLRFCFTTIVLLGSVGLVSAQYHEATPAEQTFASLEQRYAPSPTAVQQAAYVDIPPARTAAPLPSPPPDLAAPTVIPPANQPTFYPPPQGPIISPPPSDNWCLPPTTSCRSSNWTIGIEIVPSETSITNFQFGRWDDNEAVRAAADSWIRRSRGHRRPRSFLGTGRRGCNACRRRRAQHGDLQPRFVQTHLSSSEQKLRSVVGLPATSSNSCSQTTPTRASKVAAPRCFSTATTPCKTSSPRSLAPIVRGRYSLLMGEWRDT